MANPLLCSPISLADYSRYCCSGKLPKALKVALGEASQDPMLKSILCAAEMLGYLEPASAHRPGVCDPVVTVERDITVPAPEAPEEGAAVVPTEERIVSICAPLNRALVIDILRVDAANETAAIQPVTQPIFKKVNLGTFGEWCLPFEPSKATGMFSNVEHIIVPPGAGFSVYGQNFIVGSDAVYHLKMKMWAAC